MNWPEIAIGDITHVVTKGTTPTTYGMPFTDGGINFVKAEALNGDTSLERSGFAFISVDTHEKLKRSHLIEDDVLVTIAGANVGRCGIVTEEVLPANTNQAVAILRIDRDVAEPRFVYYHFKNPSTFALCQSLGGQAAQPNLNLTVLKGLKLLLPNKDTQKRIVDLLSTYDASLENNRRRIALLEEAARQLYKEWFARFRFPGHEHVPIAEGIPEGWKATSADKVINILSGGTPRTVVPDYWDGHIPFFTPKDATSSIYVLHTEKSITELGLEKCASKLYPKDTLFITARGTVGKLNLAQTPMAMNQSCYALVGKPPLSQHFLYFALEAAIQEVKTRAVGAVFDAVIKDTFKVIPFVLPPQQLIEQYSNQVSPLVRQVDILLQTNTRLIEVRDLLLPKLMNGELAA